MIRNIGGVVFATSDRECDKYVEVLRAEYNMDNYVLKINNTLRPPMYELSREYEVKRLDGTWRTLQQHLFESSKIWKIEDFIKKHISL